MVMTKDQYLASLNDGREMYYEGERINDVAKFEPLKYSLASFARIYEAREEFPDILTFKTESGAVWDRTLKIPTTYEDIVRLRELTDFYSSYVGEGCSRIPPLGMMYLIGGLMHKSRFTKLNPQYGLNTEALWRHVADNDHLICSCFSDPRGDRSKSPLEQEDLDLSLRVVEKKSDGVILRGAKIISSAAPYAHDLFITSYAPFPNEKFASYALQCLIPVATKGLKFICRPLVTNSSRDTAWALSQDEMDLFVIFDDIFVPKEKIYYAGEWQFAEWFQHQYQSWYSWIYSVRAMIRAELLLGCARLISECTGTVNFPAVKEKLTQMAIYCEAVRSFVKSSEVEYERTEDGVVKPNVSISVMGQAFTNDHFQELVSIVKDLGGASVTTVPSPQSLEKMPSLRKYFNKYFGYRKEVASAEERMKAYRLIRDLTFNGVGGRLQFLQIFENGTNTHQKMVAYENYTGFDRCLKRAKDAAARETVPSQ
jgi:4-hydroxyphenylacetate 3-monooxygenase